MEMFVVQAQKDVVKLFEFAVATGVIFSQAAVLSMVLWLNA
jgi:hypothetical protein